MKYDGPAYWTLIPNTLSIFRLGLACAFPFVPDSMWLIMIVAAGASDVLDGWLARVWQVQSWQGGLLDATADKVFVLTVLIVLAAAGKFSYLWIPVIISRDILVLFTASYAAASRLWGAFKQMHVRMFGKLATGGQYVLFLVVLLAPGKTIYGIIFGSLCSIFAALDYGKLSMQALAVCRENEKNISKT